MKAIIATAAILILLVASYWFFSGNRAAPEGAAAPDLGTYHYECDGFTFAMIPGSDVQSITVVPAPGAPFFRTVLARSGESSRRFEGGGMALVGAGEAVTVTNEQGTYACRPLPSSEYAPWNWGDDGENGTRSDLARIVSESVVGKWRSIDDATFEREFAGDGAFVDSRGDTVTRGSWRAFSSATPLSVAFPLDENTAYLRLENGSSAEAMHFRLVSLTPESLELVSMEDGSALRFSRSTDTSPEETP